MSLTIPAIFELFGTLGARMYGSEPVSQLDHALQCAELAESAGAGPELVTACLLHDIGHMLAVRNRQDHPIASAAHEPGIDDIHQFMAIPFLRHLFPEAVIEPIRLHVDAKRYLCRAESPYWDGLTSASKHSLQLQGGIYSEADAETFIRQPQAYEAVLLRRWDDQAKIAGKVIPDLEHFRAALVSSAN